MKTNFNLIFSLSLLFVMSTTLSQAAQQQAEQVPEPVASEFLFAGDAFDITFLQPTVTHQQWSLKQWKQEFLVLHQLGIKTLVIQWSQYDHVSFFSTTSGEESLLNRIAEASLDTGLEFYIGLSANSAWSKPQDLNETLTDDMLEENKRVAKIIYTHFEKHPNFRGWYIPQELTDVFYTDEQRELILGFFSELTAYLHQLTPLKAVLASGYTSPEKSHLVKFTMWWMRVFDEAGIDILIFQDGVGVAKQDQWRDIVPYLEAIAIIDNEHFSGDVWFVAEIFTQIDGPDINNKPFRAIPADFERVSQQIEVLSGFSKTMVSYAYFPYMRPASGDVEKQLHQKYRTYLQNKIKENLGQVGCVDEGTASKGMGSYFDLQGAHTVLKKDQSWETTAPHTLAVVENSSEGYKYWGYYGLQDGKGGVGLARSNDLVTWEKYEKNPLFLNVRWPSVIKSGGIFHMIATKDYGANSYLSLYTSSDGVNFTETGTIVSPQNGRVNQNPNLYYNNNDQKYYLYWYSGGGHPERWQIKVRSADTVADLADSSSEQVLIEEPYTLAAPNLLYHNGSYFLATEILEDAWKVRIYKSSSPVGPFSMLLDNPVFENGSACLSQHIFDNKLHVYYCKLLDSTWTINYRTADL